MLRQPPQPEMGNRRLRARISGAVEQPSSAAAQIRKALVIEIERVSAAQGVLDVTGLERQQKNDPVKKCAADTAEPLG